MPGSARAARSLARSRRSARPTASAAPGYLSPVAGGVGGRPCPPGSLSPEVSAEEAPAALAVPCGERGSTAPSPLHSRPACGERWGRCAGRYVTFFFLSVPRLVQRQTFAMGPATVLFLLLMLGVSETKRTAGKRSSVLILGAVREGEKKQQTKQHFLM